MSLLLAAGGLWILTAERDTAPPKASDGIAFFEGVPSSDINEIGVTHGGVSYAIVRTAGSKSDWELKRPEGARADFVKVRTLLGTLATMRSRNELASSEIDPDPSVYGLQPPELVLHVSGAFGKRVFSFGKKTSVSNRRYLQPEGDAKIYLVDESVFTALDSAPEDVRDRQPLRFDVADVAEMTVVRGEGDFLKLVRGGDSKWSLSYKDGTLPADPEVVLENLKGLKQLKAVRFVDEPGESLALYGLAKPRVIVSFKLASKRSNDPEADPPSLILQLGVGVTIGASNDPLASGGAPEGIDARAGYFFKLAGEPFIYEAGRPPFGELLQPPEYFRDRTPWKGLDPKTVERIELKSPSGSRAFKRAASGWAFEGDQAGGNQLSSDEVERWLEALLELRVVSYPAVNVMLADYTGLKKQERSVRLFVTGRTRPVELVLGDQVSGDPVNSDQGSRRNDTPPADGSDVPRWIALSQPDNAIVPAVLGGADAALLERAPESFTKKSDG